MALGGFDKSPRSLGQKVAEQNVQSGLVPNLGRNNNLTSEKILSSLVKTKHITSG